MTIIIDLNKDKSEYQPSVMALGNFDGIHIGHRDIVNRAIELAKEKKIKSSVLLFKQHTNEVFPKMPPYYLTSLKDKIEILEDMGVDIIFIIDFTYEFAQLSNDEFMIDFIRDRLNAISVVCGDDYSFGKKAKGRTKDLRAYDKAGMLDVNIVDYRYYHGKIASSTIVRRLVRKGDFNEANKMLGQNYKIRGRVVDGFKRGSRQLGFPTANISLDFPYIIPENALYLTRAIIDDKSYPSLTSVGTNPTFTDSDEVKIETYILDFNENIYGKEIQLEFLDKMRGQIKFDNKEGLIRQMQEDEDKARKYFN